MNLAHWRGGRPFLKGPVTANARQTEHDDSEIQMAGRVHGTSIGLQGEVSAWGEIDILGKEAYLRFGGGSYIFESWGNREHKESIDGLYGNSPTESQSS